MTTIAGLVRWNAERLPEAEALVHADRRHTWREPDALVDLVAAVAVDLAALVAEGPGPAAAVPDDVEESDDALIIYTSGTTGHPKGVLLDHHRELWAGLMQLPMCGLGQADRYLHLAPLYHGAGMTLATAMLLVGGAQVVMGSFDPATALEAIELERITALLAVPTMLTLMLDHPDRPHRDLTSWRMGIFGAAPMPESAVRKSVTALPHVSLMQQCGQTEAGPAGIYADTAQVRARPDASGRQAFPYMQARVLDEAGRPVVPPATGELVLRGESVMKGYWGRPADTAEVLRDGWLYTGDLVRLDAEGYLTVVDRMRDLILTGGRNVYSVEVENAVRSHPAVADCGVVGRPHEQYGETVVAVISPVGDAVPTLEEIRAHCAELIADYKLPRALVVAPIPRNASGKIVKHELRGALRAREH